MGQVILLAEYRARRQVVPPADIALAVEASCFCRAICPGELCVVRWWGWCRRKNAVVFLV